MLAAKENYKTWSEEKNERCSNEILRSGKINEKEC
jgi:hypothetical protein